ncbi:Extracellular signal-regulated kinase 1 [Gracilariopsis chorda]|uniref:Extracellular signal-regulated kinase 1 n=1 Tax=Gracilariopsis chorda TaxID=448386 RepID=A0A2V3ISA0_9FLOR|nr:Extracellular signal-regulated kinase 1 [Gracilariopsis chorda]PXF45008.1 Extracellular signal-regulated kinase 1 [Gracilariopsis chorda]PXF45011.1 Extracellular signal-regulated kinase 1 [Gracilariopsis chorda]|eukprot:PXF45002.1 Extracellular signal-regulated kinase 1 [Gracilariopsis chorda]
MVCAAFDHVNQQQVAIKRINGVTQEETDCRRTLREMLLLRHFTHEHIISLKDVYTPAVNMHNFQEVYFVTDLMEFDLHQLISSNQPISADHTRYLTYQLLNGLKYIHSAGVLHRDLKPSNILLTQECQLKICDLGLARDAPRTPYTQNRISSYTATRWYRAPEIMFGAPYTSAVDVWSVGCIVAEILLRRPIFPGRTYEEQLVKVAQTLGPPPPDLLKSLAPPAARKFAQSRLSHFPKRDVRNLFPYAPQALCDLLARMFEYDPSKRITVVDALTHPYLVAVSIGPRTGSVGIASVPL